MTTHNATIYFKDGHSERVEWTGHGTWFATDEGETFVADEMGGERVIPDSEIERVEFDEELS